jgi:hypothetical protein
MAYTFYIAEMDVLNSGSVIENFEFETGNRHFNSNFALFGVDTTQFLTNAGPVIAMALVAVVHFLICKFFLLLAKKCYKYKYCRKLAMHADEINLTLELVKISNEAYIDFLLAAIMAVSAIMHDNSEFGLYFSSVPDFVSNVLTLLFLIYCLGLPLFEFSMIRYGFRKRLIENESFKERFELFYEAFKKHDIYSLQFGTFMKFRRMLVVFILLGIHRLPHIQSGLLASLSLANIAYLHNVKPYENALDNKIELFNEATVFFVCSFSQCFFAAYPDADRETAFKNIIQYVVLFIIVGTLSLNCLIMIAHMFIDVFDLVKLRLTQGRDNFVEWMRNKDRNSISKKYPEELSFIRERELEKLNL